LAFPVSAEDGDGELEIRMRRDFGYGGFNNDIQGLFTISVRNEEQFDLEKVTFYIDDEVLYEDTESPFKYQFNTDAYELGKHVLRAEGVLTNGKVIQSNVLVYEFVPASKGWETAGQIVVPLLVILVVITAVTALITIPGKGKTIPYLPGAQKHFGILGGSICRHCRRPFARHFWGLNLGAGKFDRCPYCGKWSITRRATQEELDLADQAEVERMSAQLNLTLDTKEQFNKELDDSKYTDI